MLSTTYTITDVKAELESYSFYEYVSEVAFTAAITTAAERAERLIKQYISSGWYTTIQAKDKVSLDEYTEEHIYWAEIYFICYCFHSLHDRKELFKRIAARESRSEGGVTRSTDGPSGKALSADAYLILAKEELSMAGITVGIKLGRNISSDNNVYNSLFKSF